VRRQTIAVARVAMIVMLLVNNVQKVMASPQECSACSVVDQALGDVGQVKNGMTRGEVEKLFVRDGGASFRLRTVYVSRRCRYLKIDVDFDPDPGVNGNFSPNDIVMKVSQLYAAYPSMD